MKKLVDDILLYMAEMDCGDNSCRFRDRSKPSGMRTNGGCRCLKSLPTGLRISLEKLWTGYYERK